MVKWGFIHNIKEYNQHKSIDLHDGMCGFIHHIKEYQYMTIVFNLSRSCKIAIIYIHYQKYQTCNKYIIFIILTGYITYTTSCCHINLLPGGAPSMSATWRTWSLQWLSWRLLLIRVGQAGICPILLHMWSCKLEVSV